MHPKPQTIDPSALRQLLDQGEKLQLLDVREDDEVAICSIPGAIHIPMHDVPNRVGELDTKQRVVVYCHHGMRSQSVASYLMQHGFEDVQNLTGGIDRYAAVVDPGLARY